MRHIRPGCGFNERVVQRGFVKRHVHFGERHGRAQRDEKRAKLSRLVGLPIQHELNQRAVGNQIAMQVIPLDVFKMLGGRQQTACASAQL